MEIQTRTRGGAQSCSAVVVTDVPIAATGRDVVVLADTSVSDEQIAEALRVLAKRLDQRAARERNQ